MRFASLVGVTMMFAISGAIPAAAQQSWAEKMTATKSDYVDADGRTQIPCQNTRKCERMHACAANYALGGAKFEHNDFWCVYVGEITASYFEDAHQENDMISCKTGYFITAMNVGANYLRCGQIKNPRSSPPSVVQGEHNQFVICPGTNDSNAAVMTGYRADFARMSCASVTRAK